MIYTLKYYEITIDNGTDLISFRSSTKLSEFCALKFNRCVFGKTWVKTKHFTNHSGMLTFPSLYFDLIKYLQ